MKKLFKVALNIFCLLSAPAFSKTGFLTNDDIFELPLEELMQHQISSVTKKLQPIEDTPAAAYVITAKDIQRSGATNIAEALRLAPGVEVGVIDNSKWAVSIRGFNSRVADKLLVLLDGHTVQPPLYPGTTWEAFDLPLELIERIEVLRGPGAAFWGKNAVNGVVNIITKSAHDTVGGKVNVVIGTTQKLIATGSYGWTLDDRTSLRVNTYSRKAGGSRPALSVSEVDDNWESQRVDLRLDRELANGRILIQAGAFSTQSGGEIIASSFSGGIDVLSEDRKSHGVHLQAMLEHETASSLHTFQVFVEQTTTDFQTVKDHRKTVDLEYQQQVELFEIHDFTWGTGYRLWRDGNTPSPYVSIDGEMKTSYLANIFFQDDISLLGDEVVLTLGARIEKKRQREHEFQPNIRLLWTPDDVNSLWAAVSRVKRIPTRGEEDSTIVVVPPSIATGGLPVIKEISPLNSEELEALDFGWRRQWNSSLSTDLTGFIYNYHGVRSTGVAMPVGGFPPTHLAFMLTNGEDVHTTGVEFSSEWRPKYDWQFKMNYSWINTEFTKIKPLVLTSKYSETSPKNQVSLQASHQFNHKLEWSSFLRYTDSIIVTSPALPNGYKIPSYLNLDMRLSYKVNEQLDISIVGKGLLEPSHQEFMNDIYDMPVSGIDRSVYLKLDWSF